MAAVYDLPVLHTPIDGVELLAAFELDSTEHERRRGLGVGAVDCLSLLHGLWLLPAGGTVSLSSIPEVKATALMAAPSHARIIDDYAIERTYVPAGVIHAVGFLGRNVEQAIHRAARFTPIVERVVLLDPDSELRAVSAREAREWGVGLLDTVSGEFVVRALPRVTGVPAVYRWWIAELAYAQLVQESAQPVS